MRDSLLIQPYINNLLERACQQKDEEHLVTPTVYVANGTEELKEIPLPSLADDALTRSTQFYMLGKRFPDTTEAVFYFESRIIPADGYSAVDIHSIDPDAVSAIILVGRNRDNTEAVFARREFIIYSDHVVWNQPDIEFEPGIAQTCVDLIFAP